MQASDAKLMLNLFFLDAPVMRYSEFKLLKTGFMGNLPV